MRKSTIRYIYRILAVAAFVLAYLLVDSYLQGVLSFWGLVFLAPAAIMSSVHSYKLSVVKPAKVKAKVKANVIGIRNTGSGYSRQYYANTGYNKAA